jgi:hypothetical protein
LGPELRPRKLEVNARLGRYVVLAYWTDSERERSDMQSDPLISAEKARMVVARVRKASLHFLSS